MLPGLLTALEAPFFHARLSHVILEEGPRRISPCFSQRVPSEFFQGSGSCRDAFHLVYRPVSWRARLGDTQVLRAMPPELDTNCMLLAWQGLRGFLPGSHMSGGSPKEDIIGKVLPFKFLEVSRLSGSTRRLKVIPYEQCRNRSRVGQVPPKDDCALLAHPQG